MSSARRRRVVRRTPWSWPPSTEPAARSARHSWPVGPPALARAVAWSPGQYRDDRLPAHYPPITAVRGRRRYIGCGGASGTLRLACARSIGHSGAGTARIGPSHAPVPDLSADERPTHPSHAPVPDLSASNRHLSASIGTRPRAGGAPGHHSPVVRNAQGWCGTGRGSRVGTTELSPAGVNSGAVPGAAWQG